MTGIEEVKVVAEVHNVLNFDLVQGTALSTEPGYVTCVYTKDTSTGLAAAALVFLLFGQVLITAVTKCFCCGRDTYKPGFSRVCAILLLIFSW